MLDYTKADVIVQVSLALSNGACAITVINDQ